MRIHTVAFVFSKKTVAVGPAFSCAQSGVSCGAALTPETTSMRRYRSGLLVLTG